MNGLRQRFQSWIRAWSARRHRRDALPLLVKRGRIYILPTRFGLTLAGLLVAMLVAGLNYGNNLAIAFAFLMASLAIVAMHYCQRNLLGLRLDARTEADGFAQRQTALRFEVANESALARYEVELRCGATARRALSLAPASRHALELWLAPASRGIVEIVQWEAHTRFPFGWFHAWTYVHAPLKVFIAPSPQGRRPLPLAATPARNEISAQHEAQGDEEFAGLRPYRPGDALKNMAWKVLARGGEPAVQSFHQLAAAAEWLDWNALAGLASEARLSQLCQWVLEAAAISRPFGLRIPGVAIAPATGKLHERACLRALAAYGAESAP